jgi:hypothetical protein
MSTQQYKLRIQIDPSYGASDRISIGNAIIRLIQDRTNRGVGVSGNQLDNGLYPELKQFKGYTKQYTESSKFKAAGKSSANVNLKLSTKMIHSIKVLEHGIGFVTIGFELGRINDRAEGNITGSYGRKADPNKARNFLGITRQELDSVLSRFPKPADARLKALKLIGITGLFDDEEDETFTIPIDIGILNDFKKHINDAIDKSLNRQNMNIIIDKMAERIEKRTRSGRGVNQHWGIDKPLKKLKPITIQLREELQQDGELDSRTSPRKSNLTRTGRLLDSIRTSVIGRGLARIFLRSSRGDGKSNESVAEELAQGGRKFFKFSKKEIVSSANDYKLILHREFVKILNRLKS